MNITRFAIDNNRLTFVILFVIVLAGIQTFNSMPRAYDPGFIIRVAQVMTFFPGASPERVEKLVTSHLEDHVKSMPELDFVSSESRTGVSIVNVNIKESYTNMRPIWDQLRRKIEDAEQELPEGIQGPYVNDEFGDVFGIVFGVTGEGYSYAEMNTIAEDVRDRLLQLPEVSKVSILGAQDERVFIEYDNTRLSELNISPYQLSLALQARNIVSSGGSIKLGDERIALEPSGNYESIHDIERTVLQAPQSAELFYLSDIAKVTRGYVDPPTALIHANGEESLVIAVSMRKGGNNTRLGEQVSGALSTLKTQYPYGIEFETIYFSPDEVDKKVEEFIANLLQSIGVVTAVMLLTLKLRTGVIVSSLVPTTILLSVIVMSVLGVGIDQISLAALIIALGMLVDNGIVMAENILVQMEKGKSALNAAIDSASELRVPLLTASLTTSAAFLPIFLAESTVGEFTASLFKVVTIALICSWLISLTIVPLLCVHFLKVAPNKEDFSGPSYRWYQSTLKQMLKHRYLSVTAIMVGSLFIIIQGMPLLPKGFFPPSDRAYFKAELQMPQGTDILATQAVLNDLEGYVERELLVNDDRPDGVTSWVSYIGNAGPKFMLPHNPKPDDPRYALMILNVTDVERIDELMNTIYRYSLESHPDLDLAVRKFENGPPVENPVEVRLSGANDKLLFQEVRALKAHLNEIGGLVSIKDDWGQRIKKLIIRINQENALRIGVTSQDIAVSLQAGLSGMVLTEYREEEDAIPVLLRSKYANAQDISKLESLSVYLQNTGKSIPLTQVADVELVWDTAKILRRDGQRTVAVGAQLQPGINAEDKFSEVIPWLEARKRDWGGELSYELGGERESSGDAQTSILVKLPIAAFIIVMLLVGQFNSLRKPTIILLTIPMALAGVTLGLLVTQSMMGFMAFLGVISLSGIVINNAIVLLERIQIELESGLSGQQAIISAAMQRARPILLTTATTVLGLIPLYLGGGAMWEPMSVAIMSGLLFSTLLTLGMVPVIYAILYRVDYEHDG